MVKFEIYKDKREEFRFRLKAGNGKTILVSEGYKSKSNCINGIESVRINSQYNSNFEIVKSKNNLLYFNLKAANGQVIGTSEMYSSIRGMKNGIALVKKNAQRAEGVK